MNQVVTTPEIFVDQPISTWFAVGGNAERLCRPTSVEQVSWCVRTFDSLRVLGDGANLLVADQGIDGMVLDLSSLKGTSIDENSGVVRAQGGVRLPKLITELSRRGLAGLEVLAGIPASIGGAAVMNAGGKFGSISDVIAAVEFVGVDGSVQRLERKDIPYAYRYSGIEGVVVAVEFALEHRDPEEVRERLKSCMAYKKSTQPMKEDSAGCCFKNPILRVDVEGIGIAGNRASAGMLLDRAGCKGLRVGKAVVSHEHANFLVAESGANASDLIELMKTAAKRVRDCFGVALEREVVVWDRDVPSSDEGGQ